jgi:hypothetical protein
MGGGNVFMEVVMFLLVENRAVPLVFQFAVSKYKD